MIGLVPQPIPITMGQLLWLVKVATLAASTMPKVSLPTAHSVDDGAEETGAVETGVEAGAVDVDTLDVLDLATEVTLLVRTGLVAVVRPAVDVSPNEGWVSGVVLSVEVSPD